MRALSHQVTSRSQQRRSLSWRTRIPDQDSCDLPGSLHRTDARICHRVDQSHSRYHL